MSKMFYDFLGVLKISHVFQLFSFATLHALPGAGGSWTTHAHGAHYTHAHDVACFFVAFPTAWHRHKRSCVFHEAQILKRAVDSAGEARATKRAKVWHDNEGFLKAAAGAYKKVGMEMHTFPLKYCRGPGPGRIRLKPSRRSVKYER